MAAFPGKISKLYYFNGRGLGEQCRIILSSAGICFESNEVVVPDEMQSMRDEGRLLLDQLPMLEMPDGSRYTQSMAIVRHVARVSQLYGATPEEASTCDQLGDGIRDFLSSFTRIPFAPSSNDALNDAYFRAAPRFARLMERQLASNAAKHRSAAASAVGTAKRVPSGAPSYDGPVLVGGGLTYPDVTMTEVLLYCGECLRLPPAGLEAVKRAAAAATADGKERDLQQAVDSAAWLLSHGPEEGGIGPCPLLAEHVRAMARWPRLRDYLVSEDRRPVGGEAYRDRVRAVLDPLREKENKLAEERARAFEALSATAAEAGAEAGAGEEGGSGKTGAEDGKSS